ncbi:MAG: TonB family protein [Selenomonadaceae bacterium]|nr:TonB family protein [Selenomonadaceae bacterium]
MENYSAHWLPTILAAIAFHVLLALGFSYVLPNLTPEPKIEDVAELELIDENLLVDEAVVIDAEAIPSETVQESVPTFNAQDLVLPELKIPEPIIKPIEPPPPEIKPVEPPKPKPPPQVVNREEPKPKVETQPEKEDATKNDGRQLVTRPPITVNAVYPEKGSGLGFKGYVAFAVRIGKDGKVKSSEILQSSGRYFVDEIARKAAVQWTFKPALDQTGRPMECDKIITFDFKKL